MEKVSKHITKKGNPTPKPPTGSSSKTLAEPVVESPVVSSTTTHILDVHANRQPDSVPECSIETPTTVTDPGAVALKEELTQRFSNKEEAMKVFSLFSAMPKEKPTGATTATPPPPPIPEETTAQPSNSHTKEPQVSIGALAHNQSHVDTGPNTSTSERDEEESGGQKDDGNLAEELERMAMDEPRDEKANKGETLVSGEKDEVETLVKTSVEGETPVFESAEGETPRKFERETLFVSIEGETPSLVV